jgi:tight adherence protein B
MSPAIIIAISLLVLAGAAGVILALDSHDDVISKRVLSVVGASTTLQSNTKSLRLKGREKDTSASEKIGRIIGLEINRPELYRFPWWAVILVMTMVGFILVRVAIFFVGDMGWFAWPLSVFFGSRWYFLRGMEVYHTTLIRQMPDLLNMIVRAVRAGIPVTESFEVVARESPPVTAKEFALVTNEITIGRPLDDTLWRMARRTGLREYRFFAVALTLQAQTGGNLTETLDKLADVIRKRNALKERGKALVSEGKTTATVLTVLPLLVATVIYFTTPGYVELLVTDPLGKIILLSAIGCLLTGRFAIRQLIRGSLS